MTSYIPSLTLPSFVFENPAVSILLPVVCGTATGFAISRKHSQSGVHVKKSDNIAASVSQTAYRTLKQPPLHPPGYVFGPVWTALYATMGYTAYRAYTAGASSMNPNTVALAKVRAYQTYLPTESNTILARSDALLYPACLEPPVDTSLLRPWTTHPRISRHPCPGWYARLPHQRMGTSRPRLRMATRAIPRLG